LVIGDGIIAHDAGILVQAVLGIILGIVLSIKRKSINPLKFFLILAICSNSYYLLKFIFHLLGLTEIDYLLAGIITIINMLIIIRKLSYLLDTSNVLDSSNVLVEFCIFGEDFEKEIITEGLGIGPSDFYKKGDLVGKKQFKRKETCWSISTGYEESLDINDQLAKILNLIKPKTNILLNFMEQYALECKFIIVIGIENNQSPAVYLDREVIEFANKIKAEFDFDMYIYS